MMTTSIERDCRRARRALKARGHDVGHWRRRDCTRSHISWCRLCHMPAHVNEAGKPIGRIYETECPGAPVDYLGIGRGAS